MSRIKCVTQNKRCQANYLQDEPSCLCMHGFIDHINVADGTSTCIEPNFVYKTKEPIRFLLDANSFERFDHMYKPIEVERTTTEGSTTKGSTTLESSDTKALVPDSDKMEYVFMDKAAKPDTYIDISETMDLIKRGCQESADQVGCFQFAEKVVKEEIENVEVIKQVRWLIVHCKRIILYLLCP